MILWGQRISKLEEELLEARKTLLEYEVAQEAVIPAMRYAMDMQDAAIRLLERRCDALDAHISAITAAGQAFPVSTRPEALETEFDDGEFPDVDMDDMEMTLTQMGISNLGDPLAPDDPDSEDSE